MKQGTKFLILVVLLVVLVPLAVFGYNRLKEGYVAPNQAPTTAGSAPEQAKTTSAPDFTLIDAEGNTASLSDFYGKPVVINFWATWCGPCRSELGDFDQAHKKYGDDVVFMMVNLTDGYRDTVEGVKDFVAEKGYGFPVYFDTNYSASNAYSVSSIPQTVFVDKNGNVFYSQIGAMSGATLEEYINSIL